ncbi:MAG: hypothetical protein HUU21_19535 [Polyangiaceae bacterium]|nr:hypothetical protein [Polyangiaceae bacterium]
MLLRKSLPQALAAAVLALPLACGSPGAASGDPADSPAGANNANANANAKNADGAGEAKKTAENETTAAETNAQNPPAAEAAAPPPEPTEPAPEPITEAEGKELQKKCGPLQKAMMRHKGNDPSKILEETLKKPPKMPAADLERCTELLTRSIKLYLAAAIEVEAKLTLTRLVKGMVAAYQDKRALCPGTEKPVPADLARLKSEPYESTAADWDTPAFKCLGFSMEGQNQRFQYEVRTDPGGKKFTVIARGFPHKNGPVVEIAQVGSITEKGIEVAPPTKR